MRRREKKVKLKENICPSEREEKFSFFKGEGILFCVFFHFSRSGDGFRGKREGRKKPSLRPPPKKLLDESQIRRLREKSQVDEESTTAERRKIT
jgi:hypothetical protein